MTALRLVTPEPGRHGDTVLLIDDDQALLELMAQAFRQAGYVTQTASNGRMGLRMLDSCRPDLVVTDIVMPEMEGIGAILQIKRDQRRGPWRPPRLPELGAPPGRRRGPGQAVPILAATGHGRPALG